MPNDLVVNIDKQICDFFDLECPNSEYTSNITPFSKLRPTTDEHDGYERKKIHTASSFSL